MTTLKITKKPNDAPTVSKAPVRRADPAKRDRTQARAENKPSSTAKPDGARQRNHRFDGKQHGEPFAQNVAGEKPETERPLRSNLRAESAGESRTGEFKPRNIESRPTDLIK